MVKIKSIPVFKPLLRKNFEIKAAIKSLKEGWLGMGSYVEEFEKSIEKIIKNKKKVVAVNTGFSAIHLALILLDLKKGVLPFHCFILIEENLRDKMIKHLKSEGVDTGIHWLPNHLHTLIKNKNFKTDTLKNTNEIYPKLLSIPFHSCMKTSDSKKVVKSIQSFFKN